MNYIQPIIRPVNFNVITDWTYKYGEARATFEDFIARMIADQGKTKEEAERMWFSNFGLIPSPKPEEIYQCNVINSEVAMTVTVLKKEELLPGQRKYQVVKLNQLYLNEIDASSNLNDIPSYHLNYEDSNWFSDLTVDNILSRLKIKINEYTLPQDGEEIKSPKLHIKNLDFMVSTEFEIIDKEFEQRLFDLINGKFIQIESNI